ncbi:SRPBCC family protein [Streptomyces sp. NPDC051684]|uniref:SRPBCC family protein n=1 Tax=Streptomyces sp. NPDC051684 TaxID=3365670 RepID=UPI003787CE0F
MTALLEAPIRPRGTRPRRRRLAAVLASLLVLLAIYTGWTNARPYQLSSSIELEATPDEVWRVLSDLRAYDEWNPFIVSASGALRKDATLRLVLRDRTGDTTFTPTVLAADAGRELRWLGRIGPGLVFDGEHRFRIDKVGGHRVRLTQSESFSGVAVPFVRSTLESNTLPQFRAMNRALADRLAEVRAS